MEKTKRQPEMDRHGYCEQCKFFSIKSMGPGSPPVTICRYNPPSMKAAFTVMGPGQAAWQMASGFPQVEKTDWCGRFEPELQ